MSEAEEIARAIPAVCVCGHDPCDGLDCGPYLPGQAPRKRAAPKTPDELAAIRAKAWKTRRAVARSLQQMEDGE